jgi:hypothetical protein
MMRRFAVAMLLLCAAGATLAAGAEPVPLPSPGLPAGSMDPSGRLVEDWGTVGVRVSGELNDKATYFVDVGGPGDQSIYPCDNLEFPLSLAPGEVKELTFYAACPKSDAPQPDQTGWTPQALRQAAAAVWKDWR